MVGLIDLEYSIGERTLFSDVNLNINSCDRFGLVGANGTGKTTLLHIIMGEISPTKGYIEKPSSISIGYLPQEEIVLHGNTLIEEVLKDYNSHLCNLSRIRESMSKNPHSKELMKEYEVAEDNFHKIGGYDYESEAYKVIAGLGFMQDDYKKSVEEFSSGWQMRIILARLLLNKCDLLMLDEPTNHLDIESIQWLENYLQSYKGAMIIVSHERYFLDNILRDAKGATGVLELDSGIFRKYRTNFTGYLHESEMRKQRLIQLAGNQEKKIAEIKEFIARNKANKARTRLVKSREKYLNRLERIQIEKERKKIKVNFPLAEIYTQNLVALKNISKNYNGKAIFSDINLSIQKGDKIALIGKNGAGKSTLCRIIAGYEKPTGGEKKVSEKLKIGSFSHEILLKLNPLNTVLDEVAGNAKNEVSQNFRNFLGLFLFSGDDVFKKIEVLSGGEKTRLAILKAMIEPSNLLILDEPTYHLDSDSVDAIRRAIESYNGTIILVTHSRDLIESFANKIFELKDGHINVYPGDFSYYLWKKRGDDLFKVGKKKSKGKKSHIEIIKEQILQKGKRRDELRNIFTRPSLANNPKKARKLFDEYRRLTEEIEDLEKKLESKL
jgi:ATP-binding cassette subfamily F protein 3